MAATFAERVRQQLRDEVLDAAAAAVGQGGWQGLRMQAIADKVGISRRTLYNEFGTKTLLAEALILRITRRFLDDVDATLIAATELRAGWTAAVLSVLRAAQTDPVLTTVLIGTATEDFLPLLTSEGTPVIENATTRLSTTVLRRWPELPERETTLAAEATVRLCLSHIVRPAGDAERTASEIAELVTGYLAPMIR